MKKSEFDSLTLTSEYFDLFLEVLFSVYKNKHNIKELPSSIQLFGYGNYDCSKPNLKADLEYFTSESVNGKYLYDKTREHIKGKPQIRINKYYKSIILLYMGYEDMQMFMDNHKLDVEKEEKQISLIYESTLDKTYYYINYYFGEEGIILKGETVISSNWKKIRHSFFYPQEDGTYQEHFNIGRITKIADQLHIRNKVLMDGKLIEGSSEVYNTGHNDVAILKLLIGTYCGFDNYNKTVAGQTILERCESKEDMESMSKSPYIPPYIAMEIRNKRILNQVVAPRHSLEISPQSPYASIYGRLPGDYELTFLLPEQQSEILKFKIMPNTYKVLIISDNVHFENEAVNLLNKGSIVHFSFEIAGIIALDSIDVYFKTYYLKENSDVPNGVFSGVDSENRLVTGEVVMVYRK